MERNELERLDRDALIARAAEAGVLRPSILTRPELIDELLVRAAPRPDDPGLTRVRGWFGRARDLLARVIEKGLHLPDAAERLRSTRASSPPPSSRSMPPSALPTVTLAEIYATQGHRARALETLERVLQREPEHVAARSLLTQLKDDAFPIASSPLIPESEDEASERLGASPPLAQDERSQDVGPHEPLGFLDDEPLPTKYDVDECVAIPVDPTTLFVYWEVRDRTLAHLRHTRPGGVITLRALVIVPTWEGPQSSTRDFDVHHALSDFFVRDLPAGSIVRAAIGWRTGDVFLSIAHSPALETPPGGPCAVLADVLVRWTPGGTVPIGRDDRMADRIDRALGRMRGTRLDPRRAAGGGAFPGSSDLGPMLG